MDFKFKDFTKELKEKWPFSGHFSFNSFVKFSGKKPVMAVHGLLIYLELI